jgi:hypothetical protein
MVRREDLTEAHRAALAAIVSSPLAWSPASDLWRNGHADALAELIALELVVPWQIGPTLHYTLTPYCASVVVERHILERMTIIDGELEEDPYWAELDREPAPLHLPKRRHEIRWPWMEEIEDPRAERPDEVLMDEASGNPVLMFGQTVKIDPKLKGKGKGGAKQRKRRAG